MSLTVTISLVVIIYTAFAANPIKFATWNVRHSEGLTEPSDLVPKLKKHGINADVYVFQEVRSDNYNKIMMDLKREMGNDQWNWECAVNDNGVTQTNTMCMLYDKTKIRTLLPPDHKPKQVLWKSDYDGKVRNMLPNTPHVMFRIVGKEKGGDKSIYEILSVHLKAVMSKDIKNKLDVTSKKNLKAATDLRMVQANEILDYIWLEYTHWLVQNEQRKRIVIVGDFNERETKAAEPEKFKPYFIGAVDKVLTEPIRGVPPHSIRQIATAKTDFILMINGPAGIEYRPFHAVLKFENGEERSDHPIVWAEPFKKSGQQNGGSKKANLERYDDIIASGSYSPPADDNAIITMEILFVIFLAALPYLVMLACLCGVAASYLYLGKKQQQDDMV